MTRIVTETDNGTVAELHVGGEVALRLPENASTGYRWTVEAADADRVDVRRGESLLMSGAVGSGGEMQWIIRAKAAGTAQVRLKLWRHWEGDRSVRGRFELTLRILP